MGKITIEELHESLVRRIENGSTSNVDKEQIRQNKEDILLLKEGLNNISTELNNQKVRGVNIANDLLSIL